MPASDLAHIPFFSQLSPDELERLTQSLRRKRFPRGEVIFHEDDPGNALYIVVSGSVKIVRRAEDGRELILSLITPGNYFGELSLLDGEPRSADAIAVEASELLLLPRDQFFRVLEESPGAAIRMLGTLSRRYVRHLTDVVEDATFLDVAGRLGRVLIHLSDSRAAHEPRVALTQSDLAAMVGATRESVNKWLGNFERRGWIKRDKGDIVLLERQALWEFCLRD